MKTYEVKDCGPLGDITDRVHKLTLAIGDLRKRRRPAPSRAAGDAFRRLAERLVQTEARLMPAEQMEPLVEADPAAVERLAEAQRMGLNDALLAAFKSWATAAGFQVDKWTISLMGYLLNPLGDAVSPRDAAHSLQRIADMKTIDQAELASCFVYRQKDRHGNEGPPIMPCELRKEGQASIVIWAAWDGKQCIGDARQAMPATPALLVGLEGGTPEDAEWREPARLYTLMEYGFKLGNFTEVAPLEVTAAQAPSAWAEPEDNDTPF